MIYTASGKSGQPPWLLVLAISFFLHAVAFGGIWLMGGLMASKRAAPRAISVRLVSAAPSAAARPEKARRATPTRKLSRRLRRPLPRAERKVVNIAPSKIKAPERKRIEPKRQPEPPKRKVAEQESRAGQAEKTGPSVAALAPGSSGARMTSEEARYLMILQERIAESWQAYVPPEQGVLSEVQIKISREGRIQAFSIQRGSGKLYVDESIIRAIRKAVLPPPPRSLVDRTLVLRFWPSGAPR